MALRDRMKVNKVSTDFSQYYFYLRGVEKSGKTTLCRDLTLEMYGKPEAGLLIAVGKEIGFKALDNIQAVTASNFGEFEEIVDDLVDNYENYKDIKMIYIDTIDELVSIAEEETLRASQRQTGKKCTLNSAFGGYGAGRKHLSKIVDEKLSALNQLYGLFVIGHTKLRTIRENSVETEQEYQVLDSNLNKDYDNIVSHKADVIATITVDREVNADAKRVIDTKRYIHFRNDGFVNCGTRFSNIVDKVELSAKNFIEAIEDAIRNSMTTPMSDEQFEKARAKEIEENKAKAEEFANNHVSDVDISVDDLKALIKSTGEADRKKLVAKVKELGIDMKNLENEDKAKLKELDKFIKTL